jgi:hypothetical protein
MVMRTPISISPPLPVSALPFLPPPDCSRSCRRQFTINPTGKIALRDSHSGKRIKSRHSANAGSGTDFVR